jgi:hypothetical protein
MRKGWSWEITTKDLCKRGASAPESQIVKDKDLTPFPLFEPFNEMGQMPRSW